MGGRAGGRERHIAAVRGQANEEHDMRDPAAADDVVAAVPRGGATTSTLGAIARRQHDDNLRAAMNSTIRTTSVL